jgi:hypothetical protein
MLNMNKDYIVQFSQTNKNSGINGLKLGTCFAFKKCKFLFLAGSLYALKIIPTCCADARDSSLEKSSGQT